ncbi:MAG: hypothetical protein EA409_13870 [Saprospirales bacterium]|nr:MAG: hypothetical protein EA409_13870 [Saprospirales bacterium]
MTTRRLVYVMVVFLTMSLLVACEDRVCPDVCSESLHLKTGDRCQCLCIEGPAFNLLMEDWGQRRICVQDFLDGEEIYMMLSHQADFISCGRAEYLLLYKKQAERSTHPFIEEAEQGFFRINYYGELSRDLWGFTQFPDNDTLYIGFGLDPNVSNPTFLCNPPSSYHSGKLYKSDELLVWEKKIYESKSDWEEETNPADNYLFIFFRLNPID